EADRTDEAALAASQAIAFAAAGGPSQDIAMARALETLASVDFNRDRHQESLDAFAAARDIWIRRLGPEHPYVAVNLRKTGHTLGNLDRRVEAGAAFMRAVEIQERVLGPEHPELARTLEEQGDELVKAYHYDEALAPLRRALAISEKLTGNA